jgi:hypothetical protein
LFELLEMDIATEVMVGKKDTPDMGVGVGVGVVGGVVNVSNAGAAAAAKEAKAKAHAEEKDNLEKKEAKSRTSLSLLRSTLNDNEDGKLQLMGVSNLLADYKRKINNLEKKVEVTKEKLKIVQAKYSDKKTLDLDPEAKNLLEVYAGDCPTTRAKLNRIMQCLQWDSTRRIDNMRRTAEVKEQRKAKNPIWRDLSYLLAKASKPREKDKDKKKKLGNVMKRQREFNGQTVGYDDSDESDMEQDMDQDRVPEFVAIPRELKQQNRKRSRPNKK